MWCLLCVQVFIGAGVVWLEFVCVLCPLPEHCVLEWGGWEFGMLCFNTRYSIIL